MIIIKHFLLISLVLFTIALSGCKKNSGGSSNEENLVVETSPLANGHVETPAPGPDFPLSVTIKSAIPPGGVKIDVTGKPDGGTVAFYTASKNSTTAVNDFTITGTPAAVVAVIDVTVTSVTTPSNKWNGNYKYSRK